VTPPADAPTLLINDAHRSYRIAVDDVLLLRAELKYVSAITLGASGEPAVHILSESLAELEAAWPTHFVRTHRNSLVRRRALVGLVRGSIAAADDDDPSTESWIAQVQGITEGVSVSRRQLPAVRQALKDLGRH
jgi:two-component system response regulator AlgR